MSGHDLHEQLERLGRRPVPPPRPEFVESLLERIQLTDDLSEPAPVIYLRRQSWARARVAVAGVAAAVLLGAVGMLALARGDSDPGTSVPVQMASGQVEVDAEVKDGRLVPQEGAGQPYQDLQNGEHDATCRQGGVLKFGDGQSISCETGETLRLTIEDGRIVAATKVSATVVGVPSTSDSTTVPTSGVAPVAEPEELGLESEAVPGGIELQWAPASSPDVDRYVVVRVVAERGASLPSIEGPADGRAVAVEGTPTFETFADVKPTSDRIAYRVFALAEDDTVLARSGTLTVTLAWEPVTATSR